MFKKFFLLAGLCLTAAAGSVASANTIGPGTSCGSCMGSSYTLSYTTTAANTYDVKLLINTAGFTGPSTDYLNSVALKLTAQGSDIQTLSVISQPATFGAPSLSGLNASGCSGNGGGFFCTQSSGNGVLVGSIYNFEYILKTAPGALLTGLDAASVKALYVSSSGKQNGITSENITLSPASATTPEPQSLVLLGSGLVGVAGALRRRLRA